MTIRSQPLDLALLMIALGPVGTSNMPGGARAGLSPRDRSRLRSATYRAFGTAYGVTHAHFAIVSDGALPSKKTMRQAQNSPRRHERLELYFCDLMHLRVNSAERANLNKV